MSEVARTQHADRFPPVFATNDSRVPETVAEKVRLLIDGSVEGLVHPPAMAIASAYINVGGFSLIADALTKVRCVRLLVGAEPKAGTDTRESNDYVRDHDWLTGVLTEHEQWLKAERDLTAFTAADDAQSKRLVAWLESHDDAGTPRVQVRRYTSGFLHGKAFIIEHPTHSAVLAGSSNFTYAGLATNRELNLGYPSTGETELVQRWFDDLWEESEPYDLAALYRERWEPHSPWIIYLRMLYELYGDQELNTKSDAGLSLTEFQRDGVARMMRLLDEHGGVLVADEVGLGKTFLAGEVIRRAVNEERQRALVICPAAIKESIWDPFLVKYDISRRAVVYSYDQLRLRYEEDTTGEFRRELDDYALVVIDEAHNLRNPSTLRAEAVNVLLGGKFPKKVVLLTATPVNNSLFDLYTLVSYFIKNDGYFAKFGIPSLRAYIKEAQALDPESLSPQHLFDLMDHVAVRRTRRFVKKNYQGDRVTLDSGREETIKFPTPRVQRIDYDITGLAGELLDQVLAAISIDPHQDLVVPYSQRHSHVGRLLLARYTPSAYLRTGNLETYQIRNSGLLRSALLKRLESSPQALMNTLATMIGSHQQFLSALRGGLVLAGDALSEWTASDAEDLDGFLSDLDEKAQSQVQRTSEFHAQELTDDVEADLALLQELRDLAEAVAVSSDHKADRLLGELRTIAQASGKIDTSGLSETARRKTVIFSSFADTIIDLRSRVARAVDDADATDALAHFQGRIAPAIYGAKGGTDQSKRSDDIAHFAPETAGTLNANGDPTKEDRYDLLFTTDVLSEGVNLQQAGRMINYDLPWNPMRLVQRSGRIDRIGSKHAYITIGCFFPAERLDDLLHLEEILMRKLAYADAAIGAGEVLPGQRSKTEVVLADTKEQIANLAQQRPDLFDAEHDRGAISGEEYRRRLAKALEELNYKKRASALPYGSGSGFISSSATTNGYVFCIRIAQHPHPWFRYVPVDEHWDPIQERDIDSTDSYIVFDDTLTSLSTADPIVEATERSLPPHVYDHAFAAWEVAARDVYQTWERLTNPNNLQPEIEKAFRDAAELVYNHGSYLGLTEQSELIARLSGRWGTDVKRAVRGVVNNDGLSNRDRVEKLQGIAEEYGLSLPKPPEPLPPVSQEDVRLVAWMAVGAKYT